MARARTTPKEARVQHTTPKGAHLFVEFQLKHKNTLWHEKVNGNPGICWRFQRKQYKDAAKCNREHVCIGCARPGVPYNDCLCLEAKF